MLPEFDNNKAIRVQNGPKYHPKNCQKQILFMPLNCLPEAVVAEVELDEDDEALEGRGVHVREGAVAQVHLLQVDHPRGAEGALVQRAERVSTHAQNLSFC